MKPMQWVLLEIFFGFEETGTSMVYEIQTNETSVIMPALIQVFAISVNMHFRGKRYKDNENTHANQTLDTLRRRLKIIHGLK